MRIRTTPISAIVLGMALALALAACTHKVVSTGDQHTVDVYPDEDTYKKIAQMKDQGGVAGMLGGMGQSLAAHKVDNNTPVKIISSDDLGSQVEILDGASKGMKGFVPKANVD